MMVSPIDFVVLAVIGLLLVLGGFALIFLAGPRIKEPDDSLNWLTFTIMVVLVGVVLLYLGVSHGGWGYMMQMLGR